MGGLQRASQRCGANLGQGNVGAPPNRRKHILGMHRNLSVLGREGVAWTGSRAQTGTPTLTLPSFLPSSLPSTPSEKGPTDSPARSSGAIATRPLARAARGLPASPALALA